MKKAKIIVLLVVLGLIVLIGIQNRGVVLAKHQFGINLMFFSYLSPEVSNFVLLIGFFLVGLLLAYFSSLLGRFKAKKTIKELTGEVTSSREKIAALEKELAGLKAGSQSREAVDGVSVVSS